MQSSRIRSGLAAVALGVGALSLLGASGAAANELVGDTSAFETLAAAGDNGDVKTHESTTAYDDQRDEPKVCVFYLDAFNFDAGEAVTWWIIGPPPYVGAHDLDGVITAGPDGSGHTVNYTLPAGHYKLFWTFVGQNGIAKHKVFKVDCTPDPSPSGSVSPSPSESVSPDPSESPSADPSESPSADPSVSPSASVLPTIGVSESPTLGTTVLGVKVTKPGTLPNTGAPVAWLAVLGALLVVAGAALRGRPANGRHT